MSVDVPYLITIYMVFMGHGFVRDGQRCKAGYLQNINRLNLNTCEEWASILGEVIARLLAYPLSAPINIRVASP